MDIRKIKGVGEKTAELFHKAGVYSVEELYQYFPRTYNVYEKAQPVMMVSENTIAAIFCVITGRPTIYRGKSGKTVISAMAKDELGSNLRLTWFNMPYLMHTLRPGFHGIFRGLLKKNSKNTYEMEQASIFSREAYEEKVSSLQPIYPLTKGLTNGVVQKAVKEAFAMRGVSVPYKEDYLPKAICDRYGLIPYEPALYRMHFPKDTEDYKLARKRMAFDEFFLFLVNLRSFKEERKKFANSHSCKTHSFADCLEAGLPYELTGDQKRVLADIYQDLRGKGVMNRLIQGDVGSGKTIVALMALLTVIEAGYQGALMAPTEVLAKQHYESIGKLLEEVGIKIRLGLLVGSMKAREKSEIQKQLAAGEIDLVIGTHALIQSKVAFKDLGLVITDEQHRFGVKQRENLSGKGETPHILVMSATPIPRTLAIILYGDLDVSVIRELPSNRLPIKNCVVDTGYRDKAYEFIKKQVALGHQAYVICPMVEASEKLEAENVKDYTKRLEGALGKKIKVAGLHGKMKAEEKNQIMEAFSKNQIQVLVSTTVVEVGVNVPNATVMMIENAERFGLAGLHQLRGRVGRGSAQSYCIFISGTKKEESLDRLKILNNSNDGFEIASQDLKLRGPGELFGTMQSGDLQFLIGDIMVDADILKEASEFADAYLDHELSLTKTEEELLEERLLESMRKYIVRINL